MLCDAGVRYLRATLDTAAEQTLRRSAREVMPALATVPVPPSPAGARNAPA